MLLHFLQLYGLLRLGVHELDGGPLLRLFGEWQPCQEAKGIVDLPFAVKQFVAPRVDPRPLVILGEEPVVGVDRRNDFQHEVNVRRRFPNASSCVDECCALLRRHIVLVAVQHQAVEDLGHVVLAGRLRTVAHFDHVHLGQPAVAPLDLLHELDGHDYVLELRREELVAHECLMKCLFTVDEHSSLLRRHSVCRLAVFVVVLLLAVHQYRKAPN